MTAQVDTHRELLFVVSEVDETRNPLEIIKRIYTSLACGEIGIVDRDLLLGTLYRNCSRYGIEGGECIVECI